MYFISPNRNFDEPILLWQELQGNKVEGVFAPKNHCAPSGVTTNAILRVTWLPFRHVRAPGVDEYPAYAKKQIYFYSGMVDYNNVIFDHTKSTNRNKCLPFTCVL